MLSHEPHSYFAFRYDNWGANPSSIPGTATTTPATANTKGSYVQIASSANITDDVYWVHLFVTNESVSTSNKNMLTDLAVDPAGGTSYVDVISNILTGKAPLISTGNGVVEFLFPIFIPAGSSVALRSQCSVASGAGGRWAVTFYGRPSRPEVVPKGMISETIGAVTGTSLGTSFTPGNAVNGAWTSLGTTTKDLWWWNLAWSLNNATVTAESVTIELAWGDATNKHTIMKKVHAGHTSERVGGFGQSNLNMLEAFCPVPSGSNIYVRGICTNAPDTGYTASAIGIG